METQAQFSRPRGRVAPKDTHGDEAYRFWTTAEQAKAKEAFLAGGLRAACEAIPYRSPNSIYLMLRKQGLKGEGPERVRTLYPASPEIDAQITLVYQTRTDRGSRVALARNIGRPHWWVTRRARELGLQVPRFRQENWTPEEDELLEETIHKSLIAAAAAFKRRGFARSETAIQIRRKRLGVKPVDHGYYTASQLATVLGVDPKTIARWIEREGLPATRRGTKRTDEQHGDHHWIHVRSLRGWIGEHAQLIDLRKVDRFWFIDLMMGRGAQA